MVGGSVAVLVWVAVSMSFHTLLSLTYTCIHIHTHTHTHKHKYTHTKKCTHTHTYTHSLSHSLSHKHTCTYAHTHAHTHKTKHTHTHTQTLMYTTFQIALPIGKSMWRREHQPSKRGMLPLSLSPSHSLSHTSTLPRSFPPSRGEREDTDAYTYILLTWRLLFLCVVCTIVCLCL